MEITAVAAIAKRTCPGKSDLLQTTVGHIIHITKHRTQFRTSMLHTGVVPEKLSRMSLYVIFFRYTYYT